MEKSNKVLILSSIVLVGFVIAVFYNYVIGGYLAKPYPFNTFLWPSDFAFGDFTEMLYVIKDFSPFKEVDPFINYFPLTYIILFPFVFIQNKIFSYLLFISVFIGVFAYMNFKNFKCPDLTSTQNFQNIFIMSSVSYPFLLLLDRGNFDIFLFVLFVAFIYAYKAEKYLLSSLILAVINAFKPFSFIFLILFLLKKNYRYIFISLLMSFALIVAGFVILKGEFFHQLSVFISNIGLFKQSYVYDNANPYGMRASSSLYMMFKLIFTRFTEQGLSLTPFLAKAYDILNIVITGLIAFFAVKEKVFWKQISLLTLYMLLMPYLTNDYKLIFFFVPIWLFVNAKEKTRFDLIYAVLFGLLLISKNIIIPYDISNINFWFSLSVIINPLIMIVFIGLIIFEQFKEKKKKIENGY